MNRILETAITYPCILGVLVIVHEWGHFIVARLCQIRVDEFSIGFGPRAIRVGKRGDTEYNVRWIPLGGYVKIAGMEPDEEPLINARDKAKKLIAGDNNEVVEALSKTPLLAENTPDLDETTEQRLEDVIDGFYTKPLWQRSLVIFAGPLMSFIFGYVLILLMGCLVGTPAPGNAIDSVTPKSVAARIGLRANDRILKINNAVIHDGEQMEDIIHHSPNQRLALTIRRGAANVIIFGSPEVQKDSGTNLPIFGFTPKMEYRRVGLRSSIYEGNFITVNILTMLGDMVKRHSLRDLRAHANGPVGIAEITYQAVNDGFVEVYFLTAQLSISLAIFNLLPIPILDGGHLLLFSLEGIRRGRRLTMQQQQNFLLTGLAIIGMLFVAIMINDLSRHISP
jgi:regulator of sigma E protease